MNLIIIDYRKLLKKEIIITLFGLITTGMMARTIYKMYIEIENQKRKIEEQANLLDDMEIKLKKITESVSISVDHDTAEIITNNNHTILFNTVSMAAVTYLTYILLKKYAPVTWAIKPLIPTSLYTLIQNNTSFLQEKQTFICEDPLNKLTLLANVIKGKYIELFVKYHTSSEYTPVTLFKNKTKFDLNVSTIEKISSADIVDKVIKPITDPEIIEKISDLL